MTALAWAAIALPLLSAVLTTAWSRGRRRVAAATATAGTAAALACAVPMLVAALRDPGRVWSTESVWTPTGGIVITIGTSVDSLAAVVAVMVGVVAVLVQVYSAGYLADDPRYPSYAALVSLFTAAMLTVVLAGDLFLLLVGWEVMGVCSAFLIGHHWELPEARSASVKAFVVTRLGDVGFLFGIFTLGVAAGSFRIGTVLDAVPRMSHATVTVGTLLLLAGVVGKSAQVPLHVWLPDAMAGPTPVSALIHAATMVAAGVYLVARLYPAFLASSATLDVLAVLAVTTMLLGALAALAQDDIKRVLAYSTISQLAYMAAGLAVGAYVGAIYHLLVHAAFKALLFLAAGCVIHAVGTNSMAGMGGLRRSMPWTFVTATVGCLCAAGVPPFAGFFSKDAIVGGALAATTDGPSAPAAAWLVFLAALATALLTAAYMTRLWLRTFLGSYRGTGHPHEAGWLMRGPLVVLAVPSALLGLAALGSGIVSWLPPGAEDVGRSSLTPLPPVAPLPVPELHLEPGTALVSALLALVGVAGTWLVWRREPAEDPVRVLGRRAGPLRAAFGVDRFYDRAFVHPTATWARRTLDGDVRLIGGAVRGVGSAASLLGAAARRTQTGNAQAYLAVLAVGIALLLGWVAVLAT